MLDISIILFSEYLTATNIYNKTTTCTTTRP